MYACFIFGPDFAVLFFVPLYDCAIISLVKGEKIWLLCLGCPLAKFVSVFVLVSLWFGISSLWCHGLVCERGIS